MLKDKIYIFTFLSIMIVYIIIAFFAVDFFIRESTAHILNTQLDYGKREAVELASIIGYKSEYEPDKDQLIANIQESIEGVNNQLGFISVIDWSGKQICHPNIKLVGRIMDHDTTLVSSVRDQLTPENFYNHLKSLQYKNMSIEDSERTSAIFHLVPVKDTDWIIAAHANTFLISQKIEDMRNRFYLILFVMGLITSLIFVIVARWISSIYEKKLVLKNEKLENEVISLSKLNRAVIESRDKVNEQDSLNKNDVSKRRILTYVRNELLPVQIDEIAYVYTDNGITYLIELDGRRSTTNSSLDELLGNLDNRYFFRANRKFILSINAIDKIVRYGKNQLKILVHPKSEIAIIISKNKASEFKQWLNL